MPWRDTADIWEQAAAMRAIAQDVAHPANPLLALPGDTSPRFTPYTVFWGVVLRVTHLDVFAVLMLAGVVNYVLFVTGFARLIRLQFKDPKLPLIALLVLLVVWGTGYGQSNAYQLHMFLYTLPYVATFTYGISFHALAFLRKWIAGARRTDAAMYTVLMLVAFLSHPITAMFAFVAAGAMLLAESTWQKTLAVQLVPLVCVAAAFVWPYFDYGHVLTHGATESWFTTPHFSGQISSLGPALAGIPILIYYAWVGRHTFVVYGFLFCAGVYVSAALAQSAIGGRFIFFGTLFLHLGIALFIADALPVGWRWVQTAWPSTYLKAGLCALIILTGLRFRVHEAEAIALDLRHAMDRDLPSESAAARLSFLGAYVPAGTVVLSDENLGLILPVVMDGKVVAHVHGSPIIPHELQRRCIDAHRFFNSPLTLGERQSILRRYGAAQIVVDRSIQSKPAASFLAQLPLLGARCAGHGGVSLYDVR
jgi:hypothetical protein